MKNFSKISYSKLAIFLAVFLFSVDSSADSTSGTANAKVVSSLSVAATSPLEFGNFSAGSSLGTITQAGVVTGGVTAVTGGATRAAGVFTVNGDVGSSTPYTFTLPATATIFSGVNSMTITLSFASGSSNRTLSSGVDSVSINGSLAVAANQPSGSYTGTYTVTVNY